LGNLWQSELKHHGVESEKNLALSAAETYDQKCSLARIFTGQNVRRAEHRDRREFFRMHLSSAFSNFPPKVPLFLGQIAFLAPV
jgi:hypothetical protein